MTLFAVLAVHPEDPGCWYPVRPTPNASLVVCVGENAYERVGIGRTRALGARSTQQGALELEAGALRFGTRQRATRACELLRGAFPAYSFRVYEVSR